MTEHGQTDRGLAGPGLADETEHLAGLDGEVDLVDDVVTVSADVDPQVR